MDAKVAAKTPDERVAERLCPECGEVLTRHSARHHRAMHWPNTLYAEDSQRAEAYRRAQLLDGLIAKLDAEYAAAKASAAGN
jgi:hypothetical protein